MTAQLNEVLRVAFASISYDLLSSTAGIAAIVLLIALLTVKEVWRTGADPLDDAAPGRAPVAGRLAMLDVYLLPLLVAFTTIVVARLAELL